MSTVIVTPIIPQESACDPQAAHESYSELPICPNACGPLAFTPARACNAGRLHCQGCQWYILLDLDEERNLINALAGLTPDFHLDLFLAALVQKQVEQLGQAWSDADDRANELRERWQGLSAITVYTWHEWHAADAYEDRVSARRKVMVEALAKLRGVTPQAILDIPAGVAYGA